MEAGGERSKVLITLPFNPPPSRSGESTSLSDLSGQEESFFEPGVCVWSLRGSDCWLYIAFQIISKHNRRFLRVTLKVECLSVINVEQFSGKSQREQSKTSVRSRLHCSQIRYLLLQ